MGKRESKKQIILDCWRASGAGRAGAQEIRAIQADLRRRLAPTSGMSRSYIASVLREAGAEVEYEDRYVDPAMDEPYAARLKGLLRFGDLRSAEDSIRKLGTLHDEFRATRDRVGMSLVRRILLKGKERAQSLAGNPRVSEEKRREKKEIAGWFRVWLETPDLFLDWLELRKQSEEFGRLFSATQNESKSENQDILKPRD